MSRSDAQAPERDPIAFLAGGGEMGERVRAFDWSRTPVGPVAGWPQSLKIAVRIMLDSRYAMWLGWGPGFTFFYNDAYARMTLGPKHPWALGRSAREVWSEIWDDVGPRAESVVRTGQATWDEGLLLFLERRGFPEETYHTFSYSPLPDDAGGVGGMLCVVTEDTARTIGERRLRTLRELAARTTEQVKSVGDACATAARVLAENPHDLPFVLIYLLDGPTARLTGATGLPAGCSAAPTAVDVGDAGWPFRAVLKTGQAQVVGGLAERFGPRTDGAWPERTQQAVVLPVAKPGQTRLAGFVVAGVSPRLLLDDDYRGFFDLLTAQVATAVTNARAYEEERRRAEELAELDRAKTAFFSNVSHEFRTPLTLMLGPVEDLLTDGRSGLSPAVAGQLEVVNRNGLRLLRLVNSLLDFSRIEAGRVRAAFRPTDLASFTADLASVFRSACERAGLTLAVECPPLDRPAFVDRDMWEKVVLNLLSNAFKFTFDGGIEVRVRQAGDTAELVVRDTGTGVPAAEMPRLFERFHRVENARGRTHEGSGIGLALVQELVRLHGGAITATSAVGVGTTFVVAVPLGSAHLPSDQIAEGRDTSATGATPYVEEALRWLPTDARIQPAEEELPQPLSHPAGDDRPRVLVADDNADMRQYVVRLLDGAFRVEAVADGEAALAAARDRPPDLVLTDVMMPRLDGFGLLRALRADPRTAAVPVVMLSARAGEESRVEGVAAGADDYLVKPFSARELLARVTAHLEMARVRRESGEKVRRGEERLRMALTAARMLAWEYDPAADTIVVSDNVADLYGLPPGATVAGAAQGFALVHPDDAARHRATVETAVREAGSYESQFRLIRPVDGVVIWLEERGHAVRRPPDGALRLVGVVMDVTARKRAEQSSRDVLESITDGFFALDGDWRFTYINAAGERFLDRIPGDLIGRTMWDEFPGTVGSEFERVYRRVAAGRAAEAFTAHYPNFDRWYEVTAYPAPNGLSVYFRDVSERKRAEEQIARLAAESDRQRRLFDTALSNTPDFVYTFDLDGRFTYANAALLALLERASADVAGKNFFDLDYPPDLAARLQRHIRQVIDTRQPVRDETPFTSAAGERQYEYIFVPVVAADGAVEAVAGSTRDVTDSRRAAEALKEADRRKDEFLATLAHELRNPLAPLRSGLELIRNAGADGQVERVRAMMDRQLTQLVRLVDDLLDVSRITKGKLELRKGPTALQAVVGHAVESVRPQIDLAGHRLTVAVPDEPAVVDGDEARLAQVVANLLTNAAKYTPPGGHIRLTVGRDDGVVAVAVADDGIGIPPAMLGRVFDMFTQVDRALEKTTGGLGIGLSLVKGLVEMHGGTITARSDGEGRGSEFVVRLPAVAAGVAAPTRPPAEANGAAPPAGRRVLVVDDNEDAADALGQLLEVYGNDVRTAHDGEAGVAAAEAFRPDIVLMDLGMPRLNGYDAARRIRGQPWGRGMTLIALTGWGQDDDRRKTADAGFDLHLVKPVDPAALTKLLAGVRPE